jgi:hypothetical protein
MEGIESKEGEYDQQVNQITQSIGKKTPEPFYQSRYIRWYKECSNKKPSNQEHNLSRLKKIMIRREEERIRRLTEES